MSLSAREQQALESIRNGLAGSDPELAALVSAFNRLASDEEMPDREQTRAGSRRAFRRFRRARWRAGLRRGRQRLGVPGTVLLLAWLLTTAALIAVAVTLGAAGGRGPCTETAAVICAGPAPGQSPGSSSASTTTGQASHQGAAGIVGPPSW
jgi:hypothetical protein